MSTADDLLKTDQRGLGRLTVPRLVKLRLRAHGRAVLSATASDRVYEARVDPYIFRHRDGTYNIGVYAPDICHPVHPARYVPQNPNVKHFSAK